MDSKSSNWKRILLHWANQTGFLEQNSFNLEQTDIVDFFRKFSSRITVISQKDLILFLKENYPNVELHLDDAGLLASGDYMYVYSLFLHYSCVKHPEEFFHKICKSLSGQIQESIAKFFNTLLEKKNFNKEHVRHSIAQASPQIPLIIATNAESPTRTQLKSSPPTPSSTYMEQSTKTVNRLQSLLAAERYDKGFLELELEKNQKRLSELTKQRENHVTEIQKLKSELLSRNTENCSPNKNAQNERAETRLRNMLKEKNEEILVVKEDLDALKAEKLKIQDKLAHSEKRVKAYKEKDKENEITLNELMKEVEQKEGEIRLLIEKNKESEQFINETRNSQGNYRNDLNSSEIYDRLNVSSNLSSPENLGRSVVDIQLKEKENENFHLKNIIDQMNLSNGKLSKHIYELIVQNSDIFNIGHENLLITENCELDSILLVFENYVKKLIESYTDVNVNFQTAKKNINILNTKIIIESEKVSERERILSTYEKEMNDMKINNLSLQKTCNRLMDLNNSFEKKINEQTEESDMLLEKLKLLQSEVMECKKKNIAIQESKEELTVRMTEEIWNKSECIEKLENENRGNKLKIEEFGKILNENKKLLDQTKISLSDEKQFFENQLHIKDGEIINLNSKLTLQLTSFESLKCDNEQLTETLINTKSELEQLNNDLSEKKKDLESKKDKIKQLQENMEHILEEKKLLEEINAKEMKSATEKEERLKLKIHSILDQLKNFNKTEETNSDDINDNESILSIVESKVHACIIELERNIKELKESNANTKLLERQIHELEAEKVKTEQSIEDINERFENHDAFHKTNMQERQEHNSSLNSITEKLKKVCDDYIELRELYSTLLKANLALSQEHEKQTDLFKRLQQLNTNFAVELKTHKNSVNQLTIEASNLKKQLSDSKIEIQDLMEKIREHKNEIENLEESQSKILSEKSSIEQKLIDNEKDSEIIRIEKQKLDHELHLSMEQVSSMNSKIKDLECFSEESTKQYEDNISEFKSMINDLSTKNYDFETEIIELKNKIENQADEISRFNIQCTENISMIESLKLEKELIEKKIIIHKDDLITKEQYISSLESENVVIKLKVEELNNVLDKMKTSDNLSQQNLDETIQKLCEVEKSCTLSEEINKHLEDQVKEKTLMIEENLILIENLKKLIEKLKIDNEETLKVHEKSYEIEKIKFQSNISELEEKSIDSIKRIHELESDLKEIQNILHQTDSESNLLGHKIDELNLENQRKEIEKIAIQEEVQNLEKIIENLQIEKIELEKILDNKEAEFVAKLALKEIDLKRSNEKIIFTENLLKENKENFNTMNKLKEDYEQQNNELKIINDSMDKEIKELKIQNKYLKSKLVNLENSLENSKCKINDLEKELIQIEKLENDLKDNKNLLQEIDENRNVLKTNLESVQEENSSLLYKTEELNNIISDIKTQLQAVENNLNDNLGDKDNLIRKLKTILTERNDLLQKIEKLQIELSNKNIENQQNFEKMSELENIIKEKAGSNVLLTTAIDQIKTEKITEEKNLQKKINDLEKKYSKISTDNEKLIESKIKSENVEKNLTTRLEKTSLKLGESQAIASKLERNNTELKSENELLQKNYKKIKSQLDSLHKDNEKVNSEIMSLTLKNSEIQKKHTRISSTKDTIENKNQILEQKIEELNNSERKSKENVQKLESEKVNLHTNIEKLSKTLSNITSELKSVQNENQQHIEIIQNQDEQITNLQEETEELKRTCQEITENLVRRKNENFSLRDNTEKLSNALEEIREENTKLNDDLSKYLLRIDILKQDNQKLIKERDDLKESNLVTLNKIEDLVLQQQQQQPQNTIEIDPETQIKLTNEIDQLNNQLDEKITRINILEEQIEKSKTCEAAKVKNLLSKIDELENKLQEIDQFYKAEKALCENLKRDVSICKAKLYKERLESEENHAKWLEEKKALLDDSIKAEEKIKEVRVDMEHKLEKMKNKMKTLYSEEVNKVKTKHERELSEYKMGVKMKYETYDSYNQKLSQEIYHLNEKMLELKKQNHFLETKLKDAEMRPSLRRGTQSHAPSEWQMEDEEGEIFNNTYLTDMKNGRMSPLFGRDSVSAHELQYRNSIAAPHLRSTYTAQYADQQLREEDIKDNCNINLDDSLSSLLPNGQRKKMGGTTSYKKPGPPTPSKNAGRLSFGGNETHPRDILKETNSSAANNTITVRKTTPNKFRQMFSSRTRDEPSSMKSQNGNNSTENQRLNDWRCTSTPRKSGIHFDQRRQLSMMLNSSPYTDEQQISSDYENPNPIENNNNKNILKLKKPSSGKKNIRTELFLKWRNNESPYTTESCTTSDNNSPKILNTDNITFKKQSKTKIKRSLSKVNEGRLSISTKGQMFSKNKLPSNKFRDQMRNNAKIQRYKNFNKFRKSLTNTTNSIRIRKSILDKSLTSNNDHSKLSSIGRPSEFFDNDLKPTEMIIKEDDCNNIVLENFELLIADKESTAPFNVSDANFIISSTNNSSSQANSSSQSKTLYPATIIINRKIPHLNATLMRKSSFYIRRASDHNIHVQRDQVTLVDLRRLWNRLNYPTKIFLTAVLFWLLFDIYKQFS